MRIATWNVNSIKQRVDNAVAWIREREPDIVCFQETKSVDEAFPREPFEALGQQKVTVEHVHVHSGGQAVVGVVGAPGGGGSPKMEDQPHAKQARQIAYAPQPPMWSADKAREPVPVARDAERPV